MSQKKSIYNKIEKIETNLGENYIIKFKGESIPRLVRSSELSSLDIEKIKSSLLNKKRNKEEDESTEKTLKIRPLKNNSKRNSYESNKNCSSSSNRNINKAQNKKNKNNIDKNNIDNNNNNNYSNMHKINPKKEENFRENNNKKIFNKHNDDNSYNYRNKYKNENSQNESYNSSDNNYSDENNSNNNYSNENNSNSNYNSSNEKSSKREIIKNKLFEREGVFLEDTPKRILNVGYKNRDDKTLYCLVEWQQQSDNIRILDSIIENKKIKKKYPNLLIDFYESRLVFLEDE
jgi:hypothetical protein